ncbi:fused MFS/spermidine synthase [Aliikangiella coralliicola]|uniref:Glycosyl transferase n=1 Tax=Aliikangiella coralliicola TaxID=2592383 RepID=A0A545UF57_9GAMM|nr:fused MFS/spermidine synthase [Aliikangiella coralliicola]TQV88110.1 glycosyl transferase [Aliikangiella coralliicola]
MKKAAILLLAFCAGFSIMCFELLGGRMLAPFFGSSVYVWGSIITVFMLALSIGYLGGGRFSLYSPSINRYAGIFLVAALTLLPTIFFSESIFEFVFERIEDPRYGSLAASALVFLVPSIIMGMIAPYSVRILTVSADSSGQTAGFLYFVSTLGSAIGTIMTSFYLVLWLEVNQILWLTFGILFAAGCIALLVAKIDGEQTVSDS